ncbi:hypothetical protein [Mycolicibacterium llatzerense]|uniref:Uncharacterized protein n=1 Tax=Mycolicibacterium llatzerense TaxID=280871 RepID=A0A0D1JZ19_9MYCO|nr:hypothetical protein [Mycolicibacterium llatzerense]KIU17899.1 hypothetical protein TL10_06490 [Mycolicibacterium llatzerense]
MPDRYGEDDDPVLDFDSHRRARDTAAAREAAQRQRERLGETRAVHAPMTNDQANAARQHQRTVTEQAEKRRNASRIANCPLCNNEGYRGNQVCDHIDHTETNTRGMAKCHEVLAQIAAKKGTTR